MGRREYSAGGEENGAPGVEVERGAGGSLLWAAGITTNKSWVSRFGCSRQGRKAPKSPTMPTKATKRPSPSAVGVKRPSQQGSGACYLTLFAFILPLIFLIGLKIAQLLGYNTQIL